jgi:hypothetical protein
MLNILDIPRFSAIVDAGLRNEKPTLDWGTIYWPELAVIGFLQNAVILYQRYVAVKSSGSSVTLLPRFLSLRGAEAGEAI